MSDIAAALPSSVVVVFPATQGGTPRAAPQVYTVPLASLNLPEAAGVTGFDGAKVFHSLVVATVPGGGGTPTNDAQLTALAKQVARDFYRFALARHDVRLSGCQPWRPCGMDDVVEWEHGAEGLDTVTTRARRGPWDDAADLPRSLVGPAGPPGPAGDLTLEQVHSGNFAAPVVTITSATLLAVEDLDGFLLGLDNRLRLADATRTQAGKVNTGAQEYGGVKTFLDGPLRLGRADGTYPFAGGVTITTNDGFADWLTTYTANIIDSGYTHAGTDNHARIRFTPQNAPTSAQVLFEAYTAGTTPADATLAVQNAAGVNKVGKWGALTDGSVVSSGLITTIGTGTAVVSGGGTGQTSLTAHAVLLGEGTSAVGFAGPGTSGYVLTANGAGSDPSFQALPAAGAPGSDNGRAALGASYSVGFTANTWGAVQDSGADFAVTLTVAGTYVLAARVLGAISGSGVRLYARLYDSSNAAAAGDPAQVAFASGGAQDTNTVTLLDVYTPASVPCSVRLEAQRSSAVSATIDAGALAGCTTLRFWRIA